MIFLRWIGTKTLQGFFILLPFLIAYLLLGQMFDGLMALTQPVVDFLPIRIFPEVWLHRLMAAIILVLSFILFAIAAKTSPARRLGGWFERLFLSRFPPYAVVKSLTKWFAGNDVPTKFQPALLTIATGVQQVVAIIEKLPNDKLTVFLPYAPTPAMGVLQIVDRALVEPLDVPLTDALGWVMNWGSGTDKLLASRGESGKASRAVEAPN